LEEDPRTNRIDDSLQLFTTTCSNKLLKNSAVVLMLNKVGDMQRRKHIVHSLSEQSDRYLEEKAPSRRDGQEIVGF